MRKQYIGDGVYAEWDGHAIILTTENGLCVTNSIVLDPEVIQSFETYLTNLKRQLRETNSYGATVSSTSNDQG